MMREMLQQTAMLDIVPIFHATSPPKEKAMPNEGEKISFIIFCQFLLLLKRVS